MRHECTKYHASIDRTLDHKVVFFPPSFLPALSVFLFCKVYRQVHALFIHLRTCTYMCSIKKNVPFVPYFTDRGTIKKNTYSRTGSPSIINTCPFAELPNRALSSRDLIAFIVYLVRHIGARLLWRSMGLCSVLASYFSSECRLDVYYCALTHLQNIRFLLVPSERKNFSKKVPKSSISPYISIVNRAPRWRTIKQLT